MGNKILSRRSLLKTSGVAGAGVLALPLTQGLAAECLVTPKQTAGPFYPVRDQADKDTDLTRVKGHTVAAEGDVVVIKGQVFGDSCSEPVAGALVEIWQACASGRYNHPNDPNTSAPLDPHFQYWGRVLTDNEGRYQFRTIKPGAYPATNTWMRPPHIHFRVTARGLPTLTTQMYFAGDELNAKDNILLNIPKKQRDLVVVDFKAKEDEEDVQEGVFNIFLQADLTKSEGTPFLD